MFFKALLFGYLLCASAQDITLASGSGDSPLLEGSGETIIPPDPILNLSNSSLPEIPAELIPSTPEPQAEVRTELPTVISSNESQEIANSTNADLPAVSSIPVEITQAVKPVTEEVAEVVNLTTDDPLPSYFQDNRQEQEVNTTSVSPKVFRLPTVESFNLSATESVSVITAIINTSVSSVQWIHEDAELFYEAATRSVRDSLADDWKMIFVAPSPYRSSNGLQVSFFFSKCEGCKFKNDSCFLDSPTLIEILARNKHRIQSVIGSNITEIHIGLPEEVLILSGLTRPLTWDNYTRVAAASVIVAAFLSVLLGLAIACTRGRRREQNFFKEAAYPVDLGRNLASDEECKSSEYIISNVDGTVSRSISDQEDEECTWVVPMGEIQAEGSGDVEDTKL